MDPTLENKLINFTNRKLQNIPSLNHNYVRIQSQIFRNEFGYQIELETPHQEKTKRIKYLINGYWKDIPHLHYTAKFSFITRYLSQYGFRLVKYVAATKTSISTSYKNFKMKYLEK